MKLMTGFVSLCLLWCSLFASAQCSVHSDSDEYVNKNFVDDHPIKLTGVAGIARDPSGYPLGSVRVLLFSERKHTLLFKSQTDDDGKFNFVKVPDGRYRLIAKIAGLCPANVAIIVKADGTPARKLVLHMSPAAIDSCSYGALH